MTEFLLDVNVLIALAWPSHIHHGQARAWFRRHATEKWATCPLTQCGFVRISSNPGIIPDAVSPAQARAMLAQMVKHGRHVFWPDTLDLTSASMDEMLVAGHRQVTDAYLLALAVARDGKLATFDRSIRFMSGDGGPANGHVEVVAA